MQVLRKAAGMHASHPNGLPASAVETRHLLPRRFL